VVDLDGPAGIDELRRLVDAADVVIESARPRALEHLGIHAPAVVARRPGVTWVSITGYGRRDGEPESAGRVAFGDDAAVAGGLVAYDDHDAPVFCGDAIADPLTGLYAALAVLASRHIGGGHLLDVAMRAVATHVAQPVPNGVTSGPVSTTGCEHDGWLARAGGRIQPVLAPRVPGPVGSSTC
jgi:crotonobetainyl-CoA:carnitine CoA-transferase CaiB-like acyl-CoA transferase